MRSRWMSFPNRKTHFFKFLFSSIQEAKDLIEKHRGEMVSLSNGASGDWTPMRGPGLRTSRCMYGSLSGWNGSSDGKVGLRHFPDW